jgi:hypothetical protein
MEMVGVWMEIMQTGGFESPAELMYFIFNVSFFLQWIFVIPQFSKYAWLRAMLAHCLIKISFCWSWKGLILRLFGYHCYVLWGDKIYIFARKSPILLLGLSYFFCQTLQLIVAIDRNCLLPFITFYNLAFHNQRV